MTVGLAGCEPGDASREHLAEEPVVSGAGDQAAEPVAALPSEATAITGVVPAHTGSFVASKTVTGSDEPVIDPPGRRTEPDAEDPGAELDPAVVPDGEWAGDGPDDPGVPAGEPPPATSDTPNGPGTTTSPDLGEVSAIPNVGWEAPSVPEQWVNNALAPYPHVLPERPVVREGDYRPWTSGRGIAWYDGMIYVIDTEAGALVVMSATEGTIARVIPVGKRPEQVIVGPDGTAFVTERFGGKVHRIDPGVSLPTKTVTVGVEPYGLALSGDGYALYVSVPGENRVVALRAADLLPLGTVDAPDRPRSVAVNPLGHVYVTLQHGSVLMFETGPEGEPLTPEVLPLRKTNPADVEMHAAHKHDTNVPTRVFGATADPFTGNILVSHVQAQPGSAEQSSTELLNEEAVIDTTCETECHKTCKNVGGYGGTICNNTCNTSCVDEVKTFPHVIRPIEVCVTVYRPNESQPPETEASPPVRDPQSGEPMTSICDKPWDVQHHPLTTMAFVVCKGTDNVLVVNTERDPMRSIVGEIKVGKAPTAITITPDGTTAFVRNAVGFTVSEVDLTPLLDLKSIAPGNAPSPGFGFQQFPSGAPLTQPVNLVHSAEAIFGTDPLAEELRLGRRVFTFARYPGLSAQGFFSCSTCHFEGTDDGLVWFISDGPRQTPFLAQRLKGTEPFNWVGLAPTLQENISNTVGRMGGAGLNQDEIESLAAYLFSDDGVVPPPNPHVSPDGLTPSQKSGQLLFFHPTVGCAGCHAGPALTDGKAWDVGTFTDLEHELQGQPMPLNTPSLRGLYYSAPYLHDGSAETLYDVLNQTATTMGYTATLTGKQQEDLVSYLLTL